MSKNLTICLPDIGEGVAEGEVIEWLKNVGDPLIQDEPVVVVMTDKATVELPAPQPGKLSKQYAKPGDIVARGAPLYKIAVEGEVIEASVKETRSPKKKEKVIIENRDGGVLAAPATRKLAQNLGVDLKQISGSGQEGIILKKDVLGFRRINGKNGSLRASPPIQQCTPALHLDDDEEQPIIGLRNLIAEKMVESKYIIPHYSYFDSLDATRLIKLREKVKVEAAQEGFKATYMPFIIRALSLTIKKYPQVNGSVDLEKNCLVIHKHHHVGIATNSEMGLVVSVLKGIQKMTLREIVQGYDSLIDKTRKGELDRTDLVESTITISNFGPLGGKFATPIINYPEVAILGVAKIQKEPVVKNDHLEIRPIMNLSWSFDHRVIDGALAAQISNEFIRLLENPAQLL